MHGKGSIYTLIYNFTFMNSLSKMMNYKSIISRHMPILSTFLKFYVWQK